MKKLFLNHWTWLLFLLALGPRLGGLDRFLTSDEAHNVFTAGAQVIEAFMAGHFRETYWHFYPGVTLSWASGLGLVGQWLWQGFPQQSFAAYVDRNLADLIVAARLPYVLLSAVFVVLLYHLLYRWFDPARNNRVAHYLALTAALLVAFDPFFLAHSRVVHGDAPVAIFMSLSLLSWLVYLRDGGWGLFLFSALTGSLAALTKAPGQLMAPLVVLIAGLDWAMAWWYAGRPDWDRLRRRWWDVSRWGGLALLAMVLLWPSMWVDPLGTLAQMLDETFGKVNQGHLVFFMGQPTLDPGPWFYPYVIPFRMTPLTTIGALLSLGALWTGLRRVLSRWPVDISPRSVESKLGGATICLWLLVIALILAGNLSPKKQDRYLLPVFPLLDTLAALGWFGLWQLLVAAWPPLRRWLWGWATVLTAAQLLIVLPHHPYYLAYFNPLMGGLPRAVETTLVGWGEGMEQVAAYLNRKPDAASLYVASTPAQTFLPYFKGTGENFYTNDIALRADYVVIYRAQQQRLAPSAEIVQTYLAREPEYVVRIDGVPYAWVYPNTPLVFADVPAWGILVNLGFGDIMRLAGYHLEPGADHLTVDLFWHALPPIESDLGPCSEVKVENIETTVCPRIDYTVSLRLLDAAGRTVAQQDGWPADGLFPTSLWRVGDYVQDRHRLSLPPDLAPGTYRLAVVVYNSETQAVLGGPVEFGKVSF